MAFRIYVDESGTHGGDWLVIGMLFVPNHGPLHSDLCAVKENLGYLNQNSRFKARYKETHLTKFRHDRDVRVAKAWIDAFVKHPCYFRSIVIDWSIWNGSYFGDPFEPAALKKRRAYKKWAEMLLQPELSARATGYTIRGASLHLDRLLILQGYDVIDHLRERFTNTNYEGAVQQISKFQHEESWKDANQCLQLADLLTGSVYQSLNPAKSALKQETLAYLEHSLRPFGVRKMSAGFWRQYESASLRNHFPKFSCWFWRPTDAARLRNRSRRRRRR
jgi:hypothetical protein